MKDMTPDQLKEASELASKDLSAIYKTFQEELRRAIYWFTEDNKFIGGLLQEMNLLPDIRCPTAGLYYDKKNQSFKIVFNPYYMLSKTHEERMAILHHEIKHFTSTHHLRFNIENTANNKDDRQRVNIALDMAINQYIKGLPKGCVDVKYFKTDGGKPFPNYATAEVYDKLIAANPESRKNAGKNMEKDGIGIRKNQGGEGEGDDTGEGVLDDHGWGEMSEDEKAQAASEMGKMIKRTMEKTGFTQDRLEKELQDLMVYIDAFLSKVNYKQILRNAIKKNVSCSDRMTTWKRPNKRYGQVAQGTTIGKLPKLDTFMDTSGSISITEMNEFLNVQDSFLKVGTRNCMMHFWHTTLYHSRKYKVGSKIRPDELQSGGTDMTQVCEYINKNNPDLSIILTDGYYSTDVIPKGEVVVVISENGCKEHPLLNGYKNVKTVLLTGLKAE